MAKVELTRHLHAFFPALEGREIVVDGATVADVIGQLERVAPGIAFYICDERGRLRQHVNIFLDEERIVDREKLSDRVDRDTRIFVIQALSGG